MQLPLLLIREGHRARWTPTTIRKLGRNEDFLEELIGKAPELLGLEDLRTHVKGPYAAFHQLDVETPSKQNVAPDIVFLTESGHVVVVEVKLADNDELRGRKVISQVIEYAASLATYSETELVALFEPDLPEDSSFVDVVRKHFPECASPAELADELVRKMRAAELHLVIACDGAPDGLREFVQSVTAQHALGNYELRICELVPYVGPAGSAGDIFVVPSGVVRTEVVARTLVEVKVGADGASTFSANVTPMEQVQANIAAASQPTRVPHPQIAAVLAAWERMAEPETTVVGRAPDYRYVQVNGWPGSLHYEFLHRKTRNELGAELHFENQKWQAAANAVRDAKVQPTPEMPQLAWDQTWNRGMGRLRAVFPDDTDPDVIARAMVVLIRNTRGIVEKALGNPGASPAAL
jgi:hypothetical protein